MNPQQKQIIKDYIQAYNQFDVAAMLRHLHPEVVFENISGGTVNLRTEGRAEFEKQVRAAMRYFSKRVQTATSWKFEGETVTVEISYRATLATDLPNGLKAGEKLEMQGRSEFTFKDGLVSSLRDFS